MPVLALSSAAVRGGLQRPDWLVNIGVPLRYSRTDLADHVDEVAAEIGLSGVGIGLLTAANVTRVQRRVHDGVTVDVTVGISKPTWAADASGGFTPWRPGTINVVVQLPVTLAEGAAVNAVVTATEAKSQALFEYGVPGTGTASDAIVIVWPADVRPRPGVERKTEAEIETEREPVRFAGPRSYWGSLVAQATHEAITAGIEAAAT